MLLWGRGWAQPPRAARDGRKGPPFMGEPPGINTAANEQTEPEELKENEGGRDGWAGLGEGSILSYPPPLPRAQRPLPGSKGRGKRGSQIGGGCTYLPPHPRTDSQETGQELRQSYYEKSPYLWAGPKALNEGWASALVFIMGILRELRFPNDGCWGSQTQGPRSSRHSLPPSLYLKTWGRQRAAGRQG